MDPTIPAGTATALSAADMNGKVVLVTGGANGLGRAVARRVAGRGAHVVVADVDESGGKGVADEVGGIFVSCDVTDHAESVHAVAVAVDQFGGLDIAFFNAGVSTGFGLGDDFDPVAYRRVMGINVDGVVFGVHAAIPAIRARGGGSIVMTASLAGLTAVPFDPVYGANKHAVVGLARALGPGLEGDAITVNALCPGFADTAIVDPLREILDESGTPLLTVEEVADAFEAIIAGGGTGEAWFVQPGRPSEPFRFRNVPGIRAN